MEYLKTDAEIMQALLDGNDIYEYVSDLKRPRALTLIDGNICYSDGERAYLSTVRKYAIHVEPKWYEGLSPEKPMLAVSGHGHYYRATNYSDSIDSIRTDGGSFKPDKLTPLTREQIQVFMDNAPE